MPSHAEYAPFDGDGRLKQYPPGIRPLGQGRPTVVTNGTARRIIDQFKSCDMSNHSPQLSTLWVLIAWCQHHKQPFEVWKWDSGGVAIFLGKIPEAVCRKDAHKALSL